MTDTWNGAPPGDAAQRDGWWWVRCKVAPAYPPEAWFWIAHAQAFEQARPDDHWFPHNYECLGPCLTFAEVAAATCAAWEAARDAAQEKAHRVREECAECGDADGATAAHCIAEIIEELTPPADASAALAARIAAEKAPLVEALEEIERACIPSVPQACGPVTDAEWAALYVGSLRQLARAALRAAGEDVSGE